MKTLPVLLMVMILALSGGLAAAGNEAPADKPGSRPGADGLPWLSKSAHFSLITQWPGDEVYLSFGHSALRLHDEVLGIDVLYNYGVVYAEGGISDSLFLARFVYGQLDYKMMAFQFREDLDFDMTFQNRIWSEQVLNLNQAEANRLFRYLENNAKPENSVYRYDFILDNCSTRITMALDNVFGDQVKFDADPADAKAKSYHRMIDEFVARRPFYDWAFYLVLGRAADKVVTAREAMFLPFYLATAYDRAHIIHDGKLEPLVVSTARVYDPAKPTDHDTPGQNPAYILWPLAALVISWTLLGWWRRRKGDAAASLKAAPVAARIGDFSLLLLIGLAGLVVWFLTFISTHAAVKDNLNVLWLWPFHLVVAFLVLGGVRWRWLSWYFLAAAVLVLLPLLTWPIWPQAMHPTMVPLMLLIGFRSLDLAIRMGGLRLAPGRKAGV